MIMTVREVETWYYAITCALFLMALAAAVRARLPLLGTRVIAVGAVLNIVWEAFLFLIKGRAYDSPLPTAVQMVYHGFTEFGPLLLIFLLLGHMVRLFPLDPWRDKSPPLRSQRPWLLAALFMGIFVVGTLVYLLKEFGLRQEILVYRNVGPGFVWLEAFIAVAALTAALVLHNKRAVSLFVAMGGLNVAVELGGLVLGFRSYGEVSPLLSLAIGFGEGGAASAFTWLIVARVAPTPQ